MESFYSQIETQLYRYYDIEVEITSHEIVAMDTCSILKIYGSQGEFMLVKARLFPKSFDNPAIDKVEDLYYFDGENFIEPTTSIEEQESR